MLEENASSFISERLQRAQESPEERLVRFQEARFSPHNKQGAGRNCNNDSMILQWILGEDAEYRKNNVPQGQVG